MDQNHAHVSSDLIRGNVDTIVLKCLQIGDMYGLEICDLVKRASGGTYSLKQPTLYSSLKRLERQKLIQGYWKDSAIGGRRHYYKLSDTGLSKLSDKKGNWSDAKGVIDTLVGDLRQRREEMLDEQASDAAEVAERLASGNAGNQQITRSAKSPMIPSIDSMMEANDGTPKVLAEPAVKEADKNVLNVHSLITEILREPDSMTSKYLGAATLAPIPHYDSDTESAQVTTIPLSNRKETTPTKLKPYIFNTEFNAETVPVDAVLSKAETDIEKVENNEIVAQTAKEDVAEAVLVKDKKETAGIPISFKPKAAAQQLSMDGEILDTEHEVVPRFAKYLSPDDYARAMTTTRSGTRVAGKLVAANDIFIKPYQKQGAPKFGRGYVYLSKLRVVGALLVALAIAGALFAVRLATKPHTDGENAFFTIAFIILAGYIGVHAVVFAVSPKTTRKTKIKWENAVLRLGLFIAFVIVIMGVNVLGGFNLTNTAEYFVYWVVPCLLVSAIILEGGINFLLVKLKIFATQ